MITKNNVVGVLMGGVSGEAAISRATGTAITEALNGLGYHAIAIEYNPRNVISQLKENNVEVVFIALHGKYGEDGTIQSVLELEGIPYTGSGVSSSAITMDKIFSSRLFKQAGIRMANSLPVYFSDGIENVASSINSYFNKFPVVLKPACEGSTIGIEIVHTNEELIPALERAFAVEKRLLAEAYLDGDEFTIPVFNGKAFPIIKICPYSGTYDFHSKYTKGATEYLVPAPISDTLAKEMEEMAVKGYKAAECSGVVRFDIRTSADGTPYMLEANSIPGMTSTSLVPKSEAVLGIDFPQLCEKILLGATIRKV